MFKIKHGRTADCVVAGYREHKDGQGVGSLLLGLYDTAGRLQHVGVCASFTAARRRELAGELAPLRLADPAEHPWAAWTEESAHEASRMPGAPSRWSGGKDARWVALRPELVCEVAYDHMEGTRFRHTTRFQRWRPDRSPKAVTTASWRSRSATTWRSCWPTAGSRSAEARRCVPRWKGRKDSR